MKNVVFIIFLIVVIAGVFLVITSSNGTTASSTSKKESKVKTYSSAPSVLPAAELNGKKAKFQTSMGEFTISLFGDKAPKTVSNFISLVKDGFYNGLIFHRIIAGFMIQGGDPLGTGQGDPGYKFDDEFDPSLTFEKPGILAMANSGPNTNGSQFFITVAPFTSGNNHYSIFGEVVEGMDVVETISKIKTDSSDKPLDKVEIKTIEIL